MIAEPSPVMVVAETLSAMTFEFNVTEDMFVATTLSAMTLAVTVITFTLLPTILLDTVPAVIASTSNEVTSSLFVFK